MTHALRILPFLALPLFAACGTEFDGLDDEGQADSALRDDFIADALNDARTTVSSLRAARITRSMAIGILTHRDGFDRVPGTADDDRFDDLDEVDAMGGVGPKAIALLRAYAIGLGYGPPATGPIGSWDGVDFTAAEADATVRFANTATRAALDAGTTTAVGAAIVAARPIASMTALSAVRGVGAVAMRKLKALANAAAPATGLPDLNTATSAQLQRCLHIGPALATKIIDYRTNNGPMETHDEAAAVGAPLAAIEGLKNCVSIAAAKRVEVATVAELLANPARYNGAIVRLNDVVPLGNLSASAKTTTTLADFSVWNYTDWYGDAIPASATITLEVEAVREMRRANKDDIFEAKPANDVKLNRVNISALFEVRAGKPIVRVRAVTAPGRDNIDVVQRWVSGNQAASLVNVGKSNNFLVRTTSGYVIDRVHGALLQVHPAVLWHAAQSNTPVPQFSVVRFHWDTSWDDLPWFENTYNTFKQWVDGWVAAGRPAPQR